MHLDKWIRTENATAAAEQKKNTHMQQQQSNENIPTAALKRKVCLSQKIHTGKNKTHSTTTVTTMAAANAPTTAQSETKE